MTWGRGHGPRHRPPWWPENEPFPRHGGWGHGIPRRFRRRMVVGFLLFFALTFLASGLAVAILSGAFGLRGKPGLLFPAAFLGLALLGLAFAIVSRFVRRMARPLGDVMQAADRLAEGDSSARVEERGPRELRRLARSFNTMAERLDTAESRRRDLLADVTHELRTPLSVIQGGVEGVLDGVYPPDPAHLRPVVEEIKVMTRLLDDLQMLSTAEAGALRLRRARTEPSDLLHEAAAAFAPQAESAGIRIEERSDPALPAVEVDPVRIGQVLSNLMSNALRHTPPGGTITLSASRVKDGVAFAVDDTGSGIPEEELPHVFERFVKSSGSGGVGLGLAIARSLVRAHGGEIRAERRPEGGTAIRFELPAAD